MPSELWGYEVGQIVEVRQAIRDRIQWRFTKWEMGQVTSLTPQRTLWVSRRDGDPLEVDNPKCIREWEPPSNADSIEKYLNE